ncbi:MAG: beta-ketoacyl-ACP synthase 3, partial [Bdellovibrionales bacterium]
MIRSVFLGCGSYLPSRCVTNDELIAETKLDSSNEWIERRTGIKQRYFAGKNEKTSDMAVFAAKQALEKSGLSVDDIDAIVLATTTPDDRVPATATLVQAKLGMKRGFAVDVNAACSGFVYALATADNFIRLCQARNVLVIGAETLSGITDFTDRETCFLFGDGAGAVVLSAKKGLGMNVDQGILATALHSDGNFYDMLKTNDKGFLRMDG